MSQFYPQPQPPSYPPQGPPEENYYEEDDYDEYDYDEGNGNTDNNTIRYALAFFGGGCLIFLCMSCCLLLAGGLWAFDSSLASPTPIPGSDIGLDFNNPAYLNEAVVNDQNVILTVLRVDRNASLPAIPVVEGREVIIVTLNMENANPDQNATYSENDFLLLNSYQEAYVPTPGAGIIDGALGSGTLTPGEPVQGRLVFEIVAGEPLLVLAWEPRDGTSTSRYIELR